MIAALIAICVCTAPVYIAIGWAACRRWHAPRPAQTESNPVLCNPHF